MSARFSEAQKLRIREIAKFCGLFVFFFVVLCYASILTTKLMWNLQWNDFSAVNNYAICSFLPLGMLSALVLKGRINLAKIPIRSFLASLALLYLLNGIGIFSAPIGVGAPPLLSAAFSLIIGYLFGRASIKPKTLLKNIKSFFKTN